MITLYDSTSAADIPADAPAAAGYVDGRWPWSAADFAARETAIRIATSAATNDGDVLDVENGNASPRQAPGWLRMRQADQPGRLFVIYCNRSTLPAVEAACAGIDHGIWLADPTGTPHLAQPSGVKVVATQYAWAQLGQTAGHFDLSLAREDWLTQGGTPPAMPTIVLHNGHLNVDQNPDPSLHGQYGAAGELDWITDFQANYARPELERRGYTVKLTDGSGPNQDFAGDVFIADHYDGGAPDRAYFNAAHYQPDSTPADADRLCALLIDRLSRVLPYGDDQGTVTINETRYYGFTYESQADAIVEWGNGPNAASYAWLHDPANMRDCAAARADALDAYFGNQPAPAPPAPPDLNAQLVTMLSVIGDKTYLDPVDVIGIRLLVQQAKAKLGAN